MEGIKVTVQKTTLDGAIKALENLNAAKTAARRAGKKLKRKESKRFLDNARSYCSVLEAEAELCDDSKQYHFWEILTICSDMSRTPYETAYKLLAVLGIEVK